MNREEIKVKYACNESGYISCVDCPIIDCKLESATGYEVCWNEIAKYMQNSKNPYVEEAANG